MLPTRHRFWRQAKCNINSSNVDACSLLLPTPPCYPIVILWENKLPQLTKGLRVINRVHLSHTLRACSPVHSFLKDSGGVNFSEGVVEITQISWSTTGPQNPREKAGCGVRGSGDLSGSLDSHPNLHSHLQAVRNPASKQRGTDIQECLLLYACVCACVYACVFTHVCVFTRVYMHACVCAHVYACVHTRFPCQGASHKWNLYFYCK